MRQTVGKMMYDQKQKAMVCVCMCINTLCQYKILCHVHDECMYVMYDQK